MDEPLGALDVLTREELSLELLDIWAGTGMTVLFVAPSISKAVLLSDRVVALAACPGRIVDIQLPRPRLFAQEALPGFQDRAQHLRGLLMKRAA